jgi:UDP-glucose 4-epimerase
MHILVTGGMGYIGSHTVVELLNAGHSVTIIDNLINSKASVLPRIKDITGYAPEFIKVDILDRPGLEQVFSSHAFDSVIHFAGLKAVGESVKEPLRYYHNNVTGSLTLFETMAKFNVKNLVFSSSATVYGQPEIMPITEDFPLGANSPYGWTKLVIEQILRDLYASDPSWNIAILRYFNPVGAHPSGKIGENPLGIPNNLMPIITQVAVGILPELQVYGNDYPTPDGTGVRDYIHVVDLSLGHLKALEKLQKNPGLVTYNLGTGRGVSVLEMIKAFTKASGKKIPYQIAPRRPGDVSICFADPAKAKKELGWTAVKNLGDMCADSWRWQSLNPAGFP